MLDYLCRKEKILISFKNGLTNKGHSFKVLSGINARLGLIKDIKYKYSIEIFNNLIENTNYPIMTNILHGIDNIHLINKRKNDWYLYAINKDKITKEDTEIVQESMLNKDTLIYSSEKSMGGEFSIFYVIFSKKKYTGSHEYISQKWQGR